MNEMFSQGGKGSTGILTNKQAVARHFGVKQSEVVYFSVGVDLGGYKVIYDKETQRAYSLPADLGAGTTAVSLSTAGVLVHLAGNVDLGALAVTREEYVTLPGSFDTGVTVNTKNELVVFTDGKYRWDGALPKEVPISSTPSSTGGTGNGAWIRLEDTSLRNDLSSPKGKELIGGLNYVTLEQFKQSSDIDDTASFNASLFSGYPVVMDGSKTYTIDFATVNLTGLSDVTIYGNGATLRIVGGDIGFKSPKNVKIQDINFVGDKDKRQRIWVSNYEWFYFIRCSFTGFRQATLQSDTTAVFMYAGDVDNDLIAAGNSSHGRLIDCVFNGERLSMFGVRIYTEFQTPQVSTVTDTKVIGGSFEGYLWNAVEIAGPNTINCGVTGATAYNNGLAPFDLDKGCKDCYVEDVFIDKLTGLPPEFSSSTRTMALNIQGTSPQNIISSGNRIENVKIKLYKADLDTSTVDNAILTMANTRNNIVRNIQVEVSGGLPVSSTTKMGLAVVAFMDVEGNDVSNIKTSNASHGIIEIGETSLVGNAANKWSKISIGGTMVGEVVGIAANHAAAVRHFLEDITASTVLQQPKFTEGVSYNFKNTHANSYIDLNRCGVDQNINFVLCLKIARAGIRNCTFRHSTLTVASLIQATNSLTWLNLCNVVFNTAPVYWDTALASVTGDYKISTQLERTEINQFNVIAGADLWVNTNAPVNPVVTNWPSAQKLNRLNFTTSNGVSFVNFGGTWRAYGTLL